MLMIGLGAMAQNVDPSKNDRRSTWGMTPEQIATLQTKRMALALDLSNAQQRQVQSLNLENAGKRIEKTNEIRARRKNGKPKKISPEERYTLQLDLLDQQIAQKNRMKKILNRGQYAKWEKMAMDKGGHRNDKTMHPHRKRGHGK